MSILKRSGKQLRFSETDQLARLFMIEQFAFSHFPDGKMLQFIDTVADHGANGIRVLGFYPFGKGREEEPYLRTKHGFDLSRLNDTYIHYLYQWMTHAQKRGLIVIYELFDSVGLSVPSLTQYHPFGRFTLGNLDEFSNLSNEMLVDHQKTYVTEIVTRLKRYPNVIFGIMNEFSGDKHWHYEMSRLVKLLAPEHLTLGSKEWSSAMDDPHIDVWMLQSGSYDCRTCRSYIDYDKNILQPYLGEKILAFSTGGFGIKGLHCETPEIMRDLAKDLLNQNISIFCFSDQRAYVGQDDRSNEYPMDAWRHQPDVYNAAQIQRLNTAVYQAIANAYPISPIIQEVQTLTEMYPVISIIEDNQTKAEDSSTASGVQNRQMRTEDYPVTPVIQDAQESSDQHTLDIPTPEQETQISPQRPPSRKHFLERESWEQSQPAESNQQDLRQEEQEDFTREPLPPDTSSPEDPEQVEATRVQPLSEIPSPEEPTQQEAARVPLQTDTSPLEEPLQAEATRVQTPPDSEEVQGADFEELKRLETFPTQEVQEQDDEDLTALDTVFPEEMTQDEALLEHPEAIFPEEPPLPEENFPESPEPDDDASLPSSPRTSTADRDILDVFSVRDLPSTHPKVFQTEEGKSIKATKTRGFLCYGPYITDYPSKKLSAYFSVAVDNIDLDNRLILTVDVYDRFHEKVLARMHIKRKEFVEAHEFHLFNLPFTPEQESILEFRIYYHGWGSVVADQITIVDLDYFQIPDDDKLETELPELLTFESPSRPLDQETDPTHEEVLQSMLNDMPELLGDL